MGFAGDGQILVWAGRGLMAMVKEQRMDDNDGREEYFLLGCGQVHEALDFAQRWVELLQSVWRQKQRHGVDGESAG